MLNYSVLTADTNQAKSLSLVDGKLVKSSLANPTRGHFTAHSCETLHDFAEHINRLTIKQSLIIGSIVRPDKTVLAVGEKIALTIKDKPRDNAVSRSLEFLKNLPHSGFMLFDIDGRPETFADLHRFLPEFNGIGAVVKPSSSSLIFDKNGVEIVGDKGRHIFVPVLDMSDIQRAAVAIWGRQWLAGHGNYLISNGIHPMLLERGIYDQTVLGHSERLAFEAKPILNDGLTQKYNHCVVIDGDILDTRTIPDLTADEIAQIESLKNAAKKLVRPEYEAVIVKKKAAYIATGKTESDWNGLKNHVLTHDFEVTTTKGVFKVCEMDGSHNGVTMRDPFEPDYDGGSLTKAKFFWNDGNPKIYSQAHGGVVYKIAKQSIEGVLVDDKRVSIDWQDQLEKHVEIMNQRFCKTILGGKHRILRISELSEKVGKHKKYEFFNQFELELNHQHKLIQVGYKANGEAKYDNHIGAWAKHHKSTTYESTIFDPANNHPKNTLNTWQGFTVEPKQNHDCLALIHEHICDVVCAGNQELIDYFYDWVAYIFQNPENVAGSSLVLRGVEGAGKGTIIQLIMAIWGIHAWQIDEPESLTGNFNSRLRETCFLFADEAFFAGNKAAEGKLKGLVTEKFINIEGKGLEKETFRSRLKIIMSTNSDHAVPVTANGRRFCVFDISPHKKGDTEYFNSLVMDCGNPEVQAAFLHSALNRDISNFHTGKIPETNGLKEQRRHSLPSDAQWLLDCLYNGYLYGGLEEWNEYYTSKELYASYLVWCKDKGITHFDKKTAIGLGMFLKTCGFTKTDTRLAKGWSLGSIDSAKDVFVTVFKVHVD